MNNHGAINCTLQATSWLIIVMVLNF